LNPAAALTAFLIILPSELPDKTVFACLVMGTRYRPVFVFAGAAAAFAVHVALAVTAGGLLGLLPHRAVQAIAAGLFLIGAVLLWRQHDEGGDDAQVADTGHGKQFFPVAGMAFAVVFVADSATSPRSSRSAWRPGTGIRLSSASVRRWRCGSRRAGLSSADGAC
jgi:Ca2+/H+ antiporter, TMEM165/GDT1 family